MARAKAKDVASAMNDLADIFCEEDNEGCVRLIEDYFLCADSDMEDVESEEEPPQDCKSVSTLV